MSSAGDDCKYKALMAFTRVNDEHSDVLEEEIGTFPEPGDDTGKKAERGKLERKTARLDRQLHVLEKLERKAARLDRQLHVLEKFSLGSDPKVQGPLLFAAATSASTSTRHTIDNTGGKGDLRLAGNCLSEKMQTEINIEAKSKYLVACCYEAACLEMLLRLVTEGGIKNCGDIGILAAHLKVRASAKVFMSRVMIEHWSSAFRARAVPARRCTLHGFAEASRASGDTTLCSPWVCCILRKMHDSALSERRHVRPASFPSHVFSRLSIVTYRLRPVSQRGGARCTASPRPEASRASGDTTLCSFSLGLLHFT